MGKKDLYLLILGKAFQSNDIIRLDFKYYLDIIKIIKNNVQF